MPRALARALIIIPVLVGILTSMAVPAQAATLSRAAFDKQLVNMLRPVTPTPTTATLTVTRITSTSTGLTTLTRERVNPDSSSRSVFSMSRGGGEVYGSEMLCSQTTTCTETFNGGETWSLASRSQPTPPNPLTTAREMITRLGSPVTLTTEQGVLTAKGRGGSIRISRNKGTITLTARDQYLAFDDESLTTGSPVTQVTRIKISRVPIEPIILPSVPPTDN